MTIEVTCKTCGKKFHVRPYRVKRGKALYCSLKCSHIGRRKIKDRNIVIELYKKGLGSTRIARKLGVNPKTIKDILNREGIKLRSWSEAQRLRWKDSPLTKEILEDLYVKKELPATQIAKKFNVTPQTVYHKLKRYGIQRRSVSEALLKVKRDVNLTKDLRSLVTEDIIANYVIYRKDEFGYKEVFLATTKGFDLLCIRKNGKIEKVELERDFADFFYHKHDLQKIDRVIYYEGSVPKNFSKPTTRLSPQKYIPFAEYIYSKIINSLN